MLQSLREEIEGKLQMLLSPRKDGLTSLFKEVRVFEKKKAGWPRNRTGTGNPKNLLRLFLRNNLTRLKINSDVKNNLKRLFLALF